MRSLVYIFFIIFSLSWGFAEDVSKDEGVWVLTESNFDKVIAENKHVLVKFYAPWCVHCKSLAPEYAKAAKALVDAEVVLAKADVTVEAKLADKYEIRGFPTLKFFIDGVPREYGGGRTSDTIVSWIEKKMGPAVIPLEDKSTHIETLETANVVILGFFKDLKSEAALAYEKAASFNDEYTFYITDKEDLFKEHKVDTDSAVILYKTFDEKRNNLTEDITEESVASFVSANCLPLIVEFNQESASKIFAGDIKTHFLLFVSKSSDDVTSIIDGARKVCEDNKKRVRCVSIDIDQEENGRIAEFFGLKVSQCPAMRIISLGEEDMLKFKPTVGDMTEDNMVVFMQDYLDGKLKRDVMSADLPEDWDAKPVKVLVGSSFKEHCYGDKLLIIEFYAPWCGHCKKLAPTWDALGDKYSEDDKVMIAKIDGTTNEVDGVKVSGFPSIKCCKKNKSGETEIVDYNGERTIEGFSKFINSACMDGAEFVQDEEEEPEEDEHAAHEHEEL